MDRDIPQVEPIPAFAPYPEPETGATWYSSPRARLFAFVFSFSFALGALWTFLQPVVYGSSATVLMSAPSAIDADTEEADVQSVAIQRRILLGSEVTGELLSQIREAGFDEVDSLYLRETLRVEPVAETNLVEMVGEGPEAKLLPRLVNSWIDVYLAIRARDVEQTQRQTLDVVEDQLDQLAARLEAARTALAAYREEHDITSAERQENEVLSRLEGLNVALNNAVEAEVAAKSNLETLSAAVAAGENVVPQDERKSVSDMMRELRQLEAQMTRLSKTYTMDYILKQPKYRDVPGRIQELEEALEAVMADGREVALARAQQQHASALQSVEDLQEKLGEHEGEVARFTTIYATHQALAEDLQKLETLHRETQARLVQVQVNQVEKYPQVSVIDRPLDKSERIGPNYLLWLGGSLAAALGLGVLSVWLYGFLGHREPKPAVVTLAGVHMYPNGQLPYAPAAEPRIAATETRLLQGGEQPEDKKEEEGGEPPGKAG